MYKKKPKQKFLEKNGEHFIAKIYGIRKLHIEKNL